ncbi:MAG: prepilin-type N-terminal cleavage/methylation domain-containing protein [Phycisphaerales bacterium]|nr:MAG: prepilin-type N-terminal cleavage/methylation domain-containing protein [Phycisphaerales bacterium]
MGYERLRARANPGMYRRCRLCRVRGFTLIELLVVVSIIALLIAILVPSLALARHQVRSLQCRSNIRQLMNGMFYYITDPDVFPGTHGLFWMQSFFGTAWTRPSGVTWDGARDRMQGMSYHAAYTQPHYLDPEFIADVPGKGTIFPYVKQEKAYTCPADKPGESEDTPIGGGGNGRLSYSLNAFVAYKAPESLGSFTYVAPSFDALPGDQGTRSFAAGQRVVFHSARFMTMFEEHPHFHMNTSFPEGNFNGLDRIATRHMRTVSSKDQGARGRATIAFLDGHVDDPIYPVKTLGRELFTEFGQPHYWHETGPPDRANASAFIKKLDGPCPW